MESLRAASNTSQLMSWDMLPMAVTKRCMVRYQTLAEKEHERVEIA